MYTEFMQDIERMNRMFELPVNKSITPDSGLADRLLKFHRTLSDEVNEILDITEVLDTPNYVDGMPHYPIVDINHYVSLADLLGDIIVYCASEAIKHGIPIDQVLKVIMESQWSKLGENGEVTKDSNGKFLKGPNYKPTEEAIKKVLQANNRLESVNKLKGVIDCLKNEECTTIKVGLHMFKSAEGALIAEPYRIIEEDYND